MEGVAVTERNNTCPKEAVWIKPPQEWSWVNCPGRLLAEESLQNLLRETDWGLVKRDTEGFFLAFPYVGREPFPLPPLFCLSRIETMDGRRYLVFRFSRRGWAEPLYKFSAWGDNRTET